MSDTVQILKTLLSEGSFVSAAKRLAVTQSYLSQFVQKLEKNYGVKLIDRNSRPLQLTKLGAVILENLEKIEIIQRKTQDMCNDYLQLKVGEIRIASNSERTSAVLPPVIASFNRKYPNIRLNLEFNLNLDEVCELLIQGKADIGITFESLLSRECNAYTLLSENYLLALPRTEETLLIGSLYSVDGRYRKLQKQDARIVRKFPMINTYRHEERQQRLSKFLGTDLKTSNISALTVQNRLSFVAQGIGCAICQEKLVAIETAKEKCVFLSLDDLFKPQNLVIAWPQISYTNTAARLFCKEALSYYRPNCGYSDV